MKYTTLLILLLGLVTFIHSSSVVELTPDNFDTVIDGSKYALVKFYAPWCGHCKRMAEDFEQLAKVFKDVDDVVIAKADCDEHTKLKTRFGISGYPTLKFFKKSKNPVEYSGGRSTEELINWLNERLPEDSHGKLPEPEASLVVELTPGNFEEIVNDKNKHVFVEYFAPWCGHCKRLAPLWDQLASIFKDDGNVVIAKLDSDRYKDLGKKNGIKGYPTLKFYPKDNKEGIPYESGRDIKEFLQFIDEKTGILRLEDGTLSPGSGVIDSLTKFMKEYISNKSEDAKNKVSKAISELEEGDSKKFYERILSQLEKKENYIENEITRLQRMVEGGTITKQKKSEFSTRINILKSLL